MTVMQFDSHRGWYNPTRPREQHIGHDMPANREPKSTPIEQRGFFELLDAARNGCEASRQELATRGNSYTR